MKHQRTKQIAGSLSLLLGLASAATADDLTAAPSHPPHGLWEQGHLTGDWSGWRSKLSDRGIDFHFGYFAEVMGNVSGGLQRGTGYNGLGEAGMDVDLEKLAGWTGASFRSSSLWLHGPGVSGKYIGDELTASNIEAHDSLRLYELWFEQELFDGKVSLRLGSLLADTEFAGTDHGGLFLNSGFGWPAFISANTVNTGPAFFVAAPGARLRMNPTERCYVQAGIYDGDSFDSPAGDPGKTEHGLHWHVSDDQGYFSIYETGYLLNQAEGDKGLPGAYKLGAWHHSGDFDDNLGGRTHEGNYGVYAAGEQMVWREAGSNTQGLALFLRAGGSPQDRSRFELAVDGGIHYVGLIPGRDEDVFGVGAVYAKVSEAIRRADRLAGTPAVSDHEAVLEASYQINLAPWWSLQPDLQFIHHPGGSAAVPDALVVGLRTSLAF